MTDERAALAGLWSVSGLGEKRLAQLRYEVELSQVARLPPKEWLHATRLPIDVRLQLEGPTLLERGEELLDRAKATDTQVAWAGEPEYPARIAELPSHPPLLFYRGAGAGVPRRRIAMVGTRKPFNAVRDVTRQLAFDAASKGLTVVSGAAQGIDTLCHQGAIDAGGETWAFLGSSIDQIDGYPARLMEPALEKGGTVFSEFPPGVRGETSHFPRRNRLISGASDAVLVVRAPEGSGALHTSDYAREQGRPVLVVPGCISDDSAWASNMLVWKGEATLCLGVSDLLAAVGLDPVAVQTRALPFDPGPISPEAERALSALEKDRVDFDEWLSRVQPMRSSKLASVLVELELSGRVVECPGKLYQAR